MREPIPTVIRFRRWTGSYLYATGWSERHTLDLRYWSPRLRRARVYPSLRSARADRARLVIGRSPDLARRVECVRLKVETARTGGRR